MANKSRKEIVFDLLNAAESWLSHRHVNAGEQEVATKELCNALLAAEREFFIQEPWRVASHTEDR